MAKKKKRRVQAPSLSSVDRFIYWLLVVLSCTAGIFGYPIVMGSFRTKIFQDANILAQSNPGLVILGFFGLILGGGLAMGFDALRRRKQPIFGKNGIQYGPPQWKAVYPLFSRAFWKRFLNDRKRITRNTVVAVLLIAVSACATALGVPPRDCLYDDGSIAVYDCMNQNTRSYTASDVSKVKILTYAFHDHNGFDDWALQLRLTMEDGEMFVFSYRDFRAGSDDIHGAISGIRQIKACFDPEIVSLEGAEYLSNVIRDMHLNQDEIELLHSLFEE